MAIHTYKPIKATFVLDMVEKLQNKEQNKEYQFGYSVKDGYSLITRDYKHVCFITKEEYVMLSNALE